MSAPRPRRPRPAAYRVALDLTVNGAAYAVEVKPKTTLLEVVRDHLGLTGSKKGCDMGVCGCCTVLLNGAAVNACMTLALRAQGGTVTTIEGLAVNGELSPLQRAFIEHGALQCGYCTPGMLVAATALLAENPHPTEEEIREGLIGNLCRCTGYLKIIEAIQAVGARR